jgi:hypothetical protein
MGADWVRRVEDKFRHTLREASEKGLSPLPLFLPGAQATVTFPCHWLDENCALPPKTRLTLFQRTEASRVAVLHGSKAVGEVRGEAARDVKGLFRSNKDLCRALAVEVTRATSPAEPFYVRPVRRFGKKAAR